jgi:hypothetical protein
MFLEGKVKFPARFGIAMGGLSWQSGAKGIDSGEQTAI